MCPWNQIYHINRLVPYFSLSLNVELKKQQWWHKYVLHTSQLAPAPSSLSRPLWTTTSSNPNPRIWDIFQSIILFVLVQITGWVAQFFGVFLFSLVNLCVFYSSRLPSPSSINVVFWLTVSECVAMLAHNVPCRWLPQLVCSKNIYKILYVVGSDQG